MSTRRRVCYHTKFLKILLDIMMISNNACITYQPLAVVSDSAAIELILNVPKVANITVQVIIIQVTEKPFTSK